MSSHLGTLVENGLEEDILPHQFCLAVVTGLGVDFSPHVGDDDDILKGVIATELSEHVEVPRRYPAHSEIGDPVEIEHPGEPVTAFVSADGGMCEFCCA